MITNDNCWGTLSCCIIMCRLDLWTSVQFLFIKPGFASVSIKFCWNPRFGLMLQIRSDQFLRAHQYMLFTCRALLAVLLISSLSIVPASHQVIDCYKHERPQRRTWSWEWLPYQTKIETIWALWFRFTVFQNAMVTLLFDVRSAY